MAAREQLQLTQEEFAEKASLSLKTVQRVELKRAAPQAKTFNGLDQGAGWLPGSARLLYEEGREPVEIGRVAESASGGRPAGLLESWTDEEIERLRGATRQQIADEAASIAKFAGEDAHFRFLHDVALIKLAAAGADSASR
ncbi:helix-turn-helix domain-containing protein [Amycolatopsis plumensis]|uniref:helix-turn-helix domain-containing protein n=1 Tax=Amycolatopsis plumensis TaxID=236508 RepID=UPI0036184A19